MPNSSRKSPRALKQPEHEHSWMVWSCKSSVQYQPKLCRDTHILLLGALEDGLVVLVLDGVGDADG